MCLLFRFGRYVVCLMDPLCLSFSVCFAVSKANHSCGTEWFVQAQRSREEIFAAQEASRKLQDHLYLTCFSACKGGSSCDRLRTLIDEERHRRWHQVRACSALRDDRCRVRWICGVVGLSWAVSTLRNGVIHCI